MTNTYIKLYTFDPGLGHTAFLAAYSWPTSEQAMTAYRNAKAIFSVEFHTAAYVANLYFGSGNLLDSFWLEESSLRELRKSCWMEAHLFHAAT